MRRQEVHDHAERRGHRSEVASRPVAQNRHDVGVGQQAPVHHHTQELRGGIIRCIVPQIAAPPHLRRHHVVEGGCDGSRARAIRRPRGGVVVGHPHEQFIFDALPSQPLGLRAHRKRVPDLGYCLHGPAARQTQHDLAGDGPQRRFERAHALRREERVDGRAISRVLRRVERVGHCAEGRRRRRIRGRIRRGGDDVGMPEERDAAGRAGHRARGAHAVVGGSLVGEGCFGQGLPRGNRVAHAAIFT